MNPNPKAVAQLASATGTALTQDHRQKDAQVRHLAASDLELNRQLKHGLSPCLGWRARLPVEGLAICKAPSKGARLKSDLGRWQASAVLPGDDRLSNRFPRLLTFSGWYPQSPLTRQANTDSNSGMSFFHCLAVLFGALALYALIIGAAVWLCHIGPADDGCKRPSGYQAVVA